MLQILNILVFDSFTHFFIVQMWTHPILTNTQKMQFQWSSYITECTYSGVATCIWCVCVCHTTAHRLLSRTSGQEPVVFGSIQSDNAEFVFLKAELITSPAKWSCNLRGFCVCWGIMSGLQKDDVRERKKESCHQPGSISNHVFLGIIFLGAIRSLFL